MTRSSKFVFHPLVEPTVTVVQTAVHPVAIVTSWFEAIDTVMVGLPAQLSVIVLAAVPPLNAFRLTSRLGVANVNEADVGPPPLNEMLFVVNCNHGLDSHHTFVPQSMMPVGYCPLSGACTAVRALKSIVDVTPLFTVTVTGADVVVLPPLSRARAVNVCAPLPAVAVSHVTP